MPAYQFFNPAPVFLDLLGLAPLAGGSLQFYDQGTTTPRNTWSDSALTILNQNPVPLDSGGRADTRIFLDGAYTVVCKNASAETIWTRDIIPGGSAGQTIPALAPGFLTNDLSNLLWQEIREPPDPTGSTNQYLVTDGTQYVLTNVPSAPVVPDPEIVVGAASFQAGISSDDTKFLIKTGAGSCPASGSTGTNGSVVFDAPFGALWQVYLQAKGGGVTSGGHLPILSVTAQSATGFSVTANVNVLSGGGQSNIINAVDFSWLAIGTVEVAP